MLNNIFDPKSIIMRALHSQLDDQGVIKITFIFSTIDDHYHIMVAKDDSAGIKLELTKDEINKIKRMLIDKIYKKYQEEHDKKIKCIIIEVDLKVDTISVFTEDLKGDVELFDFSL